MPLRVSFEQLYELDPSAAEQLESLVGFGNAAEEVDVSLDDDGGFSAAFSDGERWSYDEDLAEWLPPGMEQGDTVSSRDVDLRTRSGFALGPKRS